MGTVRIQGFEVPETWEEVDLGKSRAAQLAIRQEGFPKTPAGFVDAYFSSKPKALCERLGITYSEYNVIRNALHLSLKKPLSSARVRAHASVRVPAPSGPQAAFGMIDSIAIGRAIVDAMPWDLLGEAIAKSLSTDEIFRRSVAAMVFGLRVGESEAAEVPDRVAEK